MHYALLGRTGLIVSRLGFGAMAFGARAGSGSGQPAAIHKVDDRLADQLVGRALEAGITLFDTADAYAAGESEAMLGRALGARREQVVLTTKVGFRTGAPRTQSGLSARHILWSAEQSLRRLGTDWIDLYVLHREDAHTPLEETLVALDTLVRSGKVRYLGVSNWSAWKIAAAVELQRRHGLAPFTHCQMHYSLLGRDIERDIVPMAAHYGLGLTTWGPLANGFLTDEVWRSAGAPDGGRRVSLDMLPFDRAAGKALLDRMGAIASANGHSIAQLAYAWLLSRRPVTSLLVGTSRMAQLDEAVAACGLSVDPDALAALDALTEPPSVYPNWVIDHNLADAAADLRPSP